MPRRKRRPASRINRPLYLEIPRQGTDIRIMGMIDYLLYGDSCFARLLDDAAGFETEEEERRTWQLNKDLLLGMMTENPNNPQFFRYLAGSRPWAWWKYESGIDAEIWKDPERFGYGWQRWQFDWLKEHDLLLEGEEEAVRRLCAKILEGPQYQIDDPNLVLMFTDPEVERARRREARKAFELD